MGLFSKKHKHSFQPVSARFMSWSWAPNTVAETRVVTQCKDCGDFKEFLVAKFEVRGEALLQWANKKFPLADLNDEWVLKERTS